jgi:hypothetical protein
MKQQRLPSAPPRLRVTPLLLRLCDHRSLLIAALCCALLPACNSSSGPPRYQVSGKVTYSGQPVEEGTITFADATTGQVNEGLLSPGGSYFTELPAGSFKVSITPPLVETKGTGDSPPDQIEKNVTNIPKKYRRQESSGLTADIAKDKRTFDFDLKP